MLLDKILEEAFFDADCEDYLLDTWSVVQVT